MVDGIPYEPASPTPRVPDFPRAGLAVTTRNRNDLLARALDSWRKHTPADWPLLVIDDASSTPVPGADYRFEKNAGVPVAKNKALELLMRTGVEHLFLLDDDILPKGDDWWRPYVESPEPHLAHSWNLTKIGGDERHVAYHASGGTVLYYRRAVIEDVGGMRTDFGEEGKPSWGCEHVNLSDRIFNRGWTTWRYADVAEAGRLFVELDRDPRHKSTATAAQRQHNMTSGRELWRSRIETDRDFVEYRTDADVILTCLFTGRPDPQTRKTWKPDASILRPLADSVRHGRLVVFHNELTSPELSTGNGRPVEFVRTDLAGNVYFHRWKTYWRWLREHPEVARVWCVDGSDVKQLRDPFTSIRGRDPRIFLGWEPSTVGSDWCRKNHPERRVQDFMAAHPERQLLNAGLVGGTREAVMRLAGGVWRYAHDVAVDFAQIWQPQATAKVGVGDIPALNLVAYRDFGDSRIVTGTRVSTLFKHNEGDNGFSLWSHK